MQHTRPRAVRTAALVAGAGLFTTTLACLASGSAIAAPATVDLGFYAQDIATAPGGGVIAVGSTYDETAERYTPHAVIVRDGETTPIVGLPEGAMVNAVTLAQGEIVLGGQDAGGARVWTVSAADPTHTAVDLDGFDGWSSVNALATANDTAIASGTAYDADGNENVVVGTAGETPTVVADNGSPNAMAADFLNGGTSTFVVGFDYDEDASRLWVTNADGGNGTYAAGQSAQAVVESGRIAYVADQTADGHNEIRAIDTRGNRNATVSFDDAGLITGLALSPDGTTLYAAASSSLYAVPIDDFASWKPTEGAYLSSEDGVGRLALSGTPGHLTAYSNAPSAESDGDSVVQLEAPAKPTFTAAVADDDPTAVAVTVPGDWFEDQYTVTVGDRTITADSTTCELAQTEFTCTVTGLEQGVTYDVSVTRANILGSTTSDVTSVRTPGLLAGPSTVTFAGIAQVGRTLTANVGTGWPAGTTFTYAWGWNGGQFGGLAGTGRTLTIPASLVGRHLQLIVTGTKGDDFREVHSAFVTVKAGTLTVATPTVTGKAKVGKKLAAKASASPAGAKLAYQWYAGAKPIKGAKGSTLKLTKALKGKKVSVRVTATKAGYTTATKASKAVKVS